MRLIHLLVDCPRRQVTHFMRQRVSDALCKRVSQRDFDTLGSRPLEVKILVASSICEDSSPCRFLLTLNWCCAFGAAGLTCANVHDQRW